MGRVRPTAPKWAQPGHHWGLLPYPLHLLLVPAVDGTPVTVGPLDPITGQSDGKRFTRTALYRVLPEPLHPGDRLETGADPRHVLLQPAIYVLDESMDDLPLRIH